MPTVPSRRWAAAAAVAVTLSACTIPISGEPPPAGADAEPAPLPGAAPPVDGAPDEAGPVDRLFVRVEGVLTDDTIDALTAVPGVATVEALRTDDVALFASSRPDGTPVDDLPEGFKISVAAVVEEPGLGVELGPGELAITAAGQQFRDLPVGSSVTLTDEVPRTVVAVLDDPVLDDVELVLAAEDAAALGHRERQRALLTLDGDRPATDVEVDVRALLDADAIVQPRSSTDRPMVLSLPTTKAWFGEFAFRDLDGRDVQVGASWIEANVVEAEVPLLGRVVCHRAMIAPLTAALEDVIAAGLADEIDPALYGGCWAPRRINRNANLSRHAWGIGVDINVDFDAPGLGPIPSEGVIAAFERHGFRWGGDYPIPDNHHFELVEPDPTA